MDLLILVATFATILIALRWLIVNFQDSKDVTSVLGLVLSAITGVVGAITGVAVGTRAGAASGTAVAGAATQDAKEKTAAAAGIAPVISDAKQGIDGLAEQLGNTLPSPAGENAFVLAPGQQLPTDQALRVDIPWLRELQDKLTLCESTIQSMASTR